MTFNNNQSYTPYTLGEKTSLKKKMCRRTNIWIIVKIKYDENRRVILNSEPLIRILLEVLFKKGIINEATYSRAKQE